MTFDPKRDDRVRIGPVAVPSHEWIGVFIRWEDVRREAFVVDHPVEKRRIHGIKAEALRGPADV